MSKVLVVIKSMGIGDLSILIASIHAISKKIDKPVTVLAQKSTRAYRLLENSNLDSIPISNLNPFLIILLLMVFAN